MPCGISETEFRANVVRRDVTWREFFFFPRQGFSKSALGETSVRTPRSWPFNSLGTEKDQWVLRLKKGGGGTSKMGRIYTILWL